MRCRWLKKLRHGRSGRRTKGPKLFLLVRAVRKRVLLESVGNGRLRGLERRGPQHFCTRVFHRYPWFKSGVKATKYLKNIQHETIPAFANIEAHTTLLAAAAVTMDLSPGPPSWASFSLDSPLKNERAHPSSYVQHRDCFERRIQGFADTTSANDPQRPPRANAKETKYVYSRKSHTLTLAVNTVCHIGGVVISVASGVSPGPDRRACLRVSVSRCSNFCITSRLHESGLVASFRQGVF